MSLRNQLILFLSGWAVSRFVFSLFRDITVSGIVLEPGVIAVTLMPFLVLMDFRGSSRARHLNMVASGVIADSVLYWLMRPGNDIYASIATPFDTVIWAGSIALGILFLLLYRTNAKPQPMSEYSRKRYGWLIASCVLSVALFRIAYLVTMHMPNEQRSMVVAGVEVHHIAIGALILTVLMTRTSWYMAASSLWSSIIVGSAIGMILDQSVYMSLSNITDASYNSRASWWGAMILTLAFCLVAFLYARGQSEKTAIS